METINYKVLTFLLNAVWQVTLIAGLTTCCMALLRNVASRHRHLLWVLALVLSVALPLWSLQNFGKGDLNQAPAPQSVAGAAEVDAVDASQDGSLWFSNLPSHSGPSISLDVTLTTIFVGFYFLFLAYRLLKLWQSWKTTNKIRRTAYSVPVPESIQRIIERCHATLKLSRSSVLCSPDGAGPLTVGFCPPSIIVPEHLLKEDSAELLTAALGHEMAHIRRRDFALNLIYELLYLPISFHPAAALVKRRISETRELACDEAVTERLMDAHSYARSLINFAGSVSFSSRPAYTLGVNNGNILEERVMKLLDKKPRVSARLATLLITVAALVLVAVGIGATSKSVSIGQVPTASAQSSGNLFAGTWRGKRNSTDEADYVVRITNDRGNLSGEALDYGKRQATDTKADKPTGPSKKIREAYVKLQDMNISGTTLTFRVKDGKGKTTNVTMKLVNDNEAAVEFVGELRSPKRATRTEPVNIRMRRE